MQDDGKGGSLVPKNSYFKGISGFKRRVHLVVEPRTLELPEFNVLVTPFVMY